MSRLAWPEKLVLVPFILVSAYLVFIGSLGNPIFGSLTWFNAWMNIEAIVFLKVFFPLWLVIRAIVFLIAR